MTQEQLINLMFGVIVTGVISIVGAIISWVRSAKMIPKEIESKNLENKERELSIVEKYDNIVDIAVTRAANAAVDAEKRISKLEEENKIQRKELDNLSKRLTEQKKLISEQAQTIESQNRRINAQGIRIAEQENLITKLRSDLTEAQNYSNELALILKKRGITHPKKPKIKGAVDNSSDSETDE